jgi:hypothetical protein
MAAKDQELRPVMTRIPEGLRRRLEREARFRGRSMNAEIVKRLQESFDIPDQSDSIVSDISLELDTGFSGVDGSLDEIQSQLRAILSHLGLPDPVEEAKARKAEARKAAMEARKAAMERATFMPPEIGPSAASETKDGEKK